MFRFVKYCNVQFLVKMSYSLKTILHKMLVQFYMEYINFFAKSVT